jgi:hypothetical protein
MSPYSPHKLRGVPWLLNTTSVVSVVRGASVRLLLVLEGVLTLFGT